jgi:hypothetical protein
MRYKVSLLVAAILAVTVFTACTPEGNYQWSEGASTSPDGATASRPAFFFATLQWGNDAILAGTGGPGFVFEIVVVPPPSINMRCNTRVHGPNGNESGNAPEYAAVNYCRSFTRSAYRGSGTYTGYYWGRFTIMSAGWYWYRVFKNPDCYTGPERIVAVCDGQRRQYFGPNGEMRGASAKTVRHQAETLLAVPKACVALSPRSLLKLHPDTRCARKLRAVYTPEELKVIRSVLEGAVR